MTLVHGGSVRANISQSFPESIPFIASGRYIFDTLDFLTTPFLYNLQESDAVSLKFTREGSQEGLFGAARTSLGSFPVYWAVNILSTSNNRQEVEPPLPAAADTVFLVNQITDYRFMLGSHFKSLGIAGYAILSNEKQERIGGVGLSAREAVTYNSAGRTKDSFYQPRGNRYGIELGQSTLPIPMAWTLSAEYRTTGGSDFLQVGPDESPSSRRLLGTPSTIFDQGLIPNFGVTIGKLSAERGNNRKEVRSNFLFWYTAIQKKLNVGLSYEFSLPFGSGKHTDLVSFSDNNGAGQIFILDGSVPSNSGQAGGPALPEETPFETKLSGYDISATAFADIDFYFSSEKLNKVTTPAGLKSSIFRITPAITYRNLQDKLFYNDDHNFVGSYQYLSLDLNFRAQVVLGKKKNVFLYLGWLPRVVFIKTYKTVTETKYRQITQENIDFTEIAYTNKLNSPQIEFEVFSAGLSYLFFDKLKLNLSWAPRSGGDKLDLTAVDLGIDYTF